MKPESYWSKILEFFGFREYFMSDEKNNYNSIQTRETNDSKIVSINRNQELKLIFHSPDSYDEVKNIVDDLKTGRPVILNLEKIDINIARRFVDFISGAVYGLNGKVQKVGNGVFIFTPSNIDIDGKKLGNKIKSDILSN